MNYFGLIEKVGEAATELSGMTRAGALRDSFARLQKILDKDEDKARKAYLAADLVIPELKDLTVKSLESWSRFYLLARLLSIFPVENEIELTDEQIRTVSSFGRLHSLLRFGVVSLRDLNLEARIDLQRTSAAVLAHRNNTAVRDIDDVISKAIKSGDGRNALLKVLERESDKAGKIFEQTLSAIITGTPVVRQDVSTSSYSLGVFRICVQDSLPKSIVEALEKIP